MTEAEFAIVLKAAEIKKGTDGWQSLSDGRHLTLHIAAGGAAMSVSRIERLKLTEGMIQARTSREEIYVVSLQDVIAASAESPRKGARRAGFVQDD
jgi:hypothetical protein